MEMALALVCYHSAITPFRLSVPAGWYDSVYDEELGSQPCIFTSVTPVGAPFTSLSHTRLISC